MGYIQRTLEARDVPTVMRIHCVTSGYRLINQPWTYYFKSLFHLHNETVNIWTHLIGAILVLYQMYTYYGIYSLQESELKWTVIGFGSLCFETVFNSMIAHLLHSKSPYVNYMIFLYDYLGVVCWGFGTNFLAVYGVSDEETYHWIGPNYIVFQVIIAYFIFINIGLSKMWYAHALMSIKRKMMIVSGVGLLGIGATLPWIPRYFTCYTSPFCPMSSLNHITVVLVSFIMMSIAFLVHFPENTNAGKYDIFGQSHQIFHVFVIITQSLQFRCLYIDFINGANKHCKPEIIKIIACIAVLNLSCLLTIVCVKDLVKSRVTCYLNKSR